MRQIPLNNAVQHTRSVGSVNQNPAGHQPNIHTDPSAPGGVKHPSVMRRSTTDPHIKIRSSQQLPSIPGSPYTSDRSAPSSPLVEQSPDTRGAFSEAQTDEVTSGVSHLSTSSLNHEQNSRPRVFPQSTQGFLPPQSLNAAVEKLAGQHNDSQLIKIDTTFTSAQVGEKKQKVPPSPRRPIPAPPVPTTPQLRSYSTATINGKGISAPMPNQGM
jgi:hypothetical protein